MAASSLWRVVWTWLAVYPVLKIVTLGLDPFLGHMPLAIRALVVSAIVVPIVVLVVFPALNRAAMATQ
ncbi:MAG: hypothetical protein AAFX39_05355 [Pseudomonadota bacterium]